MKKTYLPKRLLCLLIVILIHCISITTTLANTIIGEAAIGEYLSTSIKRDHIANSANKNNIKINEHGPILSIGKTISLRKLTCPESPTIRTILTSVCSGENIWIDGDFGMPGTLTGDIKVTVSPSLSTSSEDNFTLNTDTYYNKKVQLPRNTTCNPIVYTFTGMATCSDGSVILPDEETDLLFSVIVYPEYNENLIAIQKGNCDQPGKAIPTCDNYVVEGLGNPTVPNLGETGFDQWLVNYIGEQPSDQICIKPSIIYVPYDCEVGCPSNPYDCEVSCPSSPYMEADVLTACSEDIVVIRTRFRNTTSEGLSATFGIGSTVDTTRILLVNGPANVSVKLPRNHTCEPITVIYEARVLCNGKEIFGLQGDLIIEIVVYPKPGIPEVIRHPEGCGLALQTTCNNLEIEYFNPNQQVWESTPYLDTPFDGDAIEWRAYHKNYMGSCLSSGIAIASDCPQVENGCPYPIVAAKQSTLDSFNPNRTKSNNGPVILFCRLPSGLQARNFDYTNVQYEWGFYSDDRQTFIVPGKGSYNTTDWVFNTNTSLGNPGSVNHSFYVVNPSDNVSSLQQYGVLVSNNNCTTNGIVTWQGKTVEEVEKVVTDYDFLQVFPNPTDGPLNIELHHPKINGTIAIQLYNQVGQTIYHFKANKTDATHYLSLIVADLDAGIYFLEANFNGEEKYMEKLVKY